MSQFRAFVAGLAVVGLLFGTWGFAKPGPTDPQACACHNHHATAVSGESQQRLEPCPQCHGSGNSPFKCFQCNGTGSIGGVQCAACNGRGWAKCSFCNGTGQK